MTVKKSLEKHFRGWFPQEPCRSSTIRISQASITGNHIGREISIPLSQIRLISAVATAFIFGSLLYVASVNFQWLTVNRTLLIILGAFLGLLLGWLEARIVTRGLSEKEQIVVWQVLVASAIIFGVPLLLAKILLADSEFLPFAGYLFLPSIPTFGFASGWKLRSFEQKHKLQVKMLSLGYIYHKEPMIVDSNRFSTFIALVASRDGPGLWQQIGYINRLSVALESKQDIEPLKKQQLVRALKIMARYRAWGLFALASIIITGFSFLITPKLLDNSSLNFVMPIIAVYFISLIAGVFLMIKRFNSRIASLDSARGCP